MVIQKKSKNIKEVKDTKKKITKADLVELNMEELAELEQACNTFLAIGEVSDNLTGYTGSGSNKKKLDRLQRNIL